MNHTIPHRLLENAAKLADKPAYFERDGDGQWQATSWHAFGDLARQSASGARYRSGRYRNRARVKLL